jgi:hypothetical protein
MFGLLKWCFAVAILAVVLCAACDEKCCRVVPVCAVEGTIAGLGHGFLTLHCLMERPRHRGWISLRRVARLLRHQACIGLVTGLLLGVTYALVALVK